MTFAKTTLGLAAVLAATVSTASIATAGISVEGTTNAALSADNNNESTQASASGTIGVQAGDGSVAVAPAGNAALSADNNDEGTTADGTLITANGTGSAAAALSADNNDEGTAAVADGSATLKLGTGVSVNSTASAMAALSDDNNDENTMAVPRAMTLAQLVASIRAGYDTSVDLNGPLDVQTLSLSGMGGGSAELDEVVAISGEQIAMIQADAGANADIVAALDAQGYAVEDVLYIYPSTTGEVTVVVDDRA